MGRRGRPPTDPAAVARGLALLAQGKTLAEAADEAGVSKSTLGREKLRHEREAAATRRTPTKRVASKRRMATKPKRSAPAPDAPSSDAGELDTSHGTIDAEGDPLDVMRALLGNATRAIASLALDSPRLNQARAEARAITKAIAGLERERAAKETPEQAERRRRREDAETRKRIEMYVEQYEAEAAEAGTCLWCGTKLAAAAPAVAPANGAGE